MGKQRKKEADKDTNKRKKHKRKLNKQNTEERKKE
jgi:hypothetical protein